MNKEAEKLKELFIKLFNSQGINGKRLEIEEANLNFAINVKIHRNQSLNDIRTILRTFKQIEMMTEKNYRLEVEMYFPYLSLYMDEY